MYTSLPQTAQTSLFSPLFQFAALPVWNFQDSPPVTAVTPTPSHSPHQDDSSLLLLQQLHHRYTTLLSQAEQLAGELPRLSSTLQLRMMAIGRAMEQLSIKQQQASAAATGGCRHIPVSPVSMTNLLISASESSTAAHGGGQLPTANQLRKWLQSVEAELEKIREHIPSAKYHYAALSQLRASQQVSRRVEFRQLRNLGDTNSAD